MNTIHAERRNRLLGVLGLTLLALLGLWFGLISPQRQHLRLLADRKAGAQHKLDQMKLAISNAPQTQAELAEKDTTLTQLEAGMASGDLYSWAINSIRQFKLPYKVEIPQFSQIDGPKEMSLLPQFPFKQATLTVAGTAYFHDFGRFLVDFENQFPYMRVLNLSLEPAAIQGDPEKLAFKMDILMLVKPGAS